MEQHMVERLAATLGRADEHAEVLPRCLLADELVKRTRAKRRIGVFRRALRAGDAVGIGGAHASRSLASPRCHGQRPSISASRLKLSKVRMKTMTASEATFSRV